LQQRGSVTPGALAAWHPPHTGQRGRPRDYSDVAIETGHLLRLAFGRPWRQTEGLLRSLTILLGVNVGVPDHTTFPRRSPGLALATALAQAQASDPVHVVIDATGLKVYGASEWLVEKHGERGKRTSRKLHLAVDPSSGELLASELTGNEDGDASQVGPLLEQIAGPIASMTAHGAYDGELVYRAVAERQPDPPVTVIIPRAQPRCRARTPAPPLRWPSIGCADRTFLASSAQPARPTHPDGRGPRAPRMAEGDRLRPAIARGNDNAPLQSHHRQRPSRPDSACPEHRNQDRLLGAEPDD